MEAKYFYRMNFFSSNFVENDRIATEKHTKVIR